MRVFRSRHPTPSKQAAGSRRAWPLFYLPQLLTSSLRTPRRRHPAARRLVRWGCRPAGVVSPGSLASTLRRLPGGCGRRPPGIVPGRPPSSATPRVGSLARLVVAAGGVPPPAGRHRRRRRPSCPAHRSTRHRGAGFIVGIHAPRPGRAASLPPIFPESLAASALRSTAGHSPAPGRLSPPPIEENALQVKPDALAWRLRQGLTSKHGGRKLVVRR